MINEILMKYSFGVFIIDKGGDGMKKSLLALSLLGELCSLKISL